MAVPSVFLEGTAYHQNHMIGFMVLATYQTHANGELVHRYLFIPHCV